MLYMVREGFAERAEAFVANGGHLVTTYWTGVVDETDLCHLGGFGPLRKLLGIWAEEIECWARGTQPDSGAGRQRGRFAGAVSGATFMRADPR